MAGFRTHISFSTFLGCGYAAYGSFGVGLPPDTAILGGALCGLSGMLPDIDSDYGVPLRETMAFTAAIVPMLLVGHLTALDLSHDGMVLVAISVYLGIRFGLTRLIRKWTVHRGMFHSIPAGLIFAGVAFLLAGTCPTYVRYFKAGGVFLGFMSHLVLDEIYSVEWKGGRWQFKKSFGTAVKLWSDDGWANFSTYSKLAIVGMMVLGEPSVMEQLQARNPAFAERYQRLQQRFESVSALSGAAAGALDAARSAAERFAAEAHGFRPLAGNSQSASAGPAVPAGAGQQAMPVNGGFYPGAAFDQPPVELAPPQYGQPPYSAPQNAQGYQYEAEAARRPWGQVPQ